MPVTSAEAKGTLSVLSEDTTLWRRLPGNANALHVTAGREGKGAVWEGRGRDREGVRAEESL